MSTHSVQSQNTNYFFSFCADPMEAAYSLSCVIHTNLQSCITASIRVSESLSQARSTLAKFPRGVILLSALIAGCPIGTRASSGFNQTRVSLPDLGELRAVVANANACFSRMSNGQTHINLVTKISGETHDIRFLAKQWDGNEFLSFGYGDDRNEVIEIRTPTILIKKIDTPEGNYFHLASSVIDTRDAWIQIAPIMKYVIDDYLSNIGSVPSHPAVTPIVLPKSVSEIELGMASSWQMTPTNGTVPYIVAILAKLPENDIYVPPFKVVEGIEPTTTFFPQTAETLVAALNTSRTSLKIASLRTQDGNVNKIIEVSPPRSFRFIHNPQIHATDDPNVVLVTYATGRQSEGITQSIDAAFVNLETESIEYAFQIDGSSAPLSSFYSHTTERLTSDSFLTTYRANDQLLKIAFNTRGVKTAPSIINESPITSDGKAQSSLFKTEPRTTGCSSWQAGNNTVDTRVWSIDDFPPSVQAGEPYPQTALIIPQPPSTASDPATTTAVAVRTMARTTMSGRTPSGRSMDNRIVAPSLDNQTVLAASISATVVVVLCLGAVALLFAIFHKRRRQLTQSNSGQQTTASEPPSTSSTSDGGTPHYALAPVQSTDMSLGTGANGSSEPDQPTAEGTPMAAFNMGNSSLPQYALAPNQSTDASVLPHANGSSRPASNTYAPVPNGTELSTENNYDGTDTAMSGVSYGQLRPDPVYSGLGPDQAQAV